MEITPEVIEKAVYQFYHDSDTQDEAHQWLTTAQMSAEAWKFSWSLLYPSKPTEVQFYGATTIHIKISRFWHELPDDQYNPLRERLMECIISYSSGPKLILSRLCIALSSLMVHTLSHHWTTAVHDIISSLLTNDSTRLPPDDALKILLEILTVLPEEFQTIAMTNSKRGLTRNVLNQSSREVLVHLQKWLQEVPSQSTDVNVSALKCLNSWIQFSSDLSDIEAFLPLLMHVMAYESLLESCLETLVNIILHPELSKYSNLLNRLLGFVLSLDPLLKRSIGDNDLNMCSTLYGVVAALMETHSKVLLETFYNDPDSRDMILRLVDILLQCSATPGHFPVDETCSEVAFGIWYILQDDALSSNPERTPIYLRYLVPVYKSLVEILLVKVSYPPDDVYTSWNNEEKNQLRCYRQDIGDTFMYCYNLLRENMLNLLLSHLSVALQTSQDPQWQQIEACLFAFQSIADSVGTEEIKFLPNFFSLLSSVPMKNGKVTTTALDAIGAYAEWIGQHPEVLKNVVPLLLMGLNDADVALSASLSMKEISRDCQRLMIPFADTILTACQGALQSNVIRPNERIRLMATIGYVLSPLPVTTIMSYLDKILVPCIRNLQTISLQQLCVSNKPVLNLALNMLGMLFATLDTRVDDDDPAGNTSSKDDNNRAPVLLIMQQIMPTLLGVASAWHRDVDVCQSLCSLLKRSVSTLLDEFKPVLTDALELIMHVYQNSPNCHCLDVAKQNLLVVTSPKGSRGQAQMELPPMQSILHKYDRVISVVTRGPWPLLVQLFGSDEGQQYLIFPFLQRVNSVTLSVVDPDLHSQTDLVESYLLMLTQLMKKIPKVVLSSLGEVTATFNFASAALCLPEAPSVKAASQFLSVFINQSRDYASMTEVVNAHGEMLLGHILRIIGGESSRCMVDHMADILLSLNKKYFDNLCRWMNTYINEGTLPSSTITRQQKEHYARLILKERSNRRRLHEVIKEYTLLCRGLIGTEYGKQSFSNL